MKVKYDLKPGDTVRTPEFFGKKSDIGIYIGMDGIQPTVVFLKKKSGGWKWEDRLDRKPFKDFKSICGMYKYAWHFTEGCLSDFYILKTVDGRKVKGPPSVLPPQQKKLLDVPSVPKEYIRVNRRKVENKTVKAEEIGI